MQVNRNPTGIGFPDDELPETTKHCVRESVQVGDLSRVLLEHAQDNIWRSWLLFSDELCTSPVSYAPLLLDIDNEDHDLEGAYDLTRDCLALLGSIPQFHPPNRLRVVFSGIKGFHIEARPNESVDNRAFRETLLSGLKKMKRECTEVTNCFLDGVIDRDHDFIRLTGSLNSWKEDNALRKRKVIQLAVEDFRRSQVKDILETSEVA